MHFRDRLHLLQKTIREGFETEKWVISSDCIGYSVTANDARNRLRLI